MRRGKRDVDLAVGFVLVALMVLVAVRLVADSFVAYPREGTILLMSIALGFIIAVARKLWKRSK